MNHCNTADTNSKHRLIHEDAMTHNYDWPLTEFQFLIWTNKKESRFVCESNSYEVWSWILWINVRSVKTVLSLTLVTITIQFIPLLIGKSVFFHCLCSTNVYRALLVYKVYSTQWGYTVNKANTSQEFPESKSSKGIQETSNFNNVLYILIFRTHRIVE